MARPVISQNERVLLHLLEMDSHRDEPEVPLAVSQEGIANRLGTQVHNASRALSVLESDGLVADRLAHVRGAPKRRRAYFLTDKGHKAARRIEEDLLKSTTVYQERERTEELSLAEVIKRLKALADSEVSLFDLVGFIREVDVLRADQFSRRFTPSARKEACIESAFGRPRVEAFFGREPERRALISQITGPASVILIWGIPGIGKTSLGSKLFDELSGRKHLFWYAFHSWDTEEHFLSILSRFLESARRSSTASEMRRGASTGDLFAPLVEDLAALDSVIFLDDVHKASDRLAVTVSIVLEAARASRSASVVLMAREMPPYFSQTSDGYSVMELGGLDLASARKMAERYRAEDPVKAADESRGHPMLLNLISRSGVSESKGDILTYLDREVSMSISQAERSLLDLLSVYRHPVPADAILEGDDSALKGLKDKALILEQETGIWTHDLLRDFFSARMSADTREILHARAAKYCEGREGADWMLESLHHHVEAGDVASATQVALRAFPELSAEFPEETLVLLGRIRPSVTDRADAAALDFHLGQLCEAVNDDAAASAHYETSLKALPDGSEERAMVLEAIGKLKTRVEQWSESFAAHEKALRIYESKDDSAGQIREWLNIGGAYRKRGDYVRSKEAYGEALSLASKNEDRAAQAACLNNIALLDWDRGSLREAELGLKESVRLAHAVKNHSGEARGTENLAELYRLQARIPEMTGLLLESSQAFSRAGEIDEAKRLRASHAEALGMLGRTDEAIALCRKALAAPELRKKTGILRKGPRFDYGDAALSFALIGLLRTSGDFKAAEAEVRRLADMADTLSDTVLLSKAKMELALIKESSGDLDSAAAQLTEAKVLLDAVGDKAGLAAIHLMLGNIMEKTADYDGAREHYQEAARQAELSGNAVALSSALMNLQSLANSE